MKIFYKLIPFIILTALVLWVSKGLFQYDVFYTQDLRRHLGRSYDAVITLNEGSFPLRWAGILNYDCGVPMFNFYNPLLYYLVAIGYFFTDHIILSLKIVNLLALLIGTLVFYLWTREETQDKWVSLSASIVYLFAPYTFLLIYVRGSPEYLAYAILPFVLFFYSKSFGCKTKRDFLKYTFLASISGGFLMISHNLAALLCFSLIVVYMFVKSLTQKIRYKSIIIFSIISIIGFGSFFIFPALLEKKYTQLDTPIFNHADHFPTLSQVINSKWGYGDSAIGTIDDGMSFQLGYAQWLVLGIGILWFIWILIKKEKSRKNVFLTLVFFSIALIYLYLILPYSLWVWNLFPILQTFQFSWRLLGITAFCVASFFALMMTHIKTKIIKVGILFAVVLLAVVGNRNHLLAQPVYENDRPFYIQLDKVTDTHKFLGDFSDTVLPPSAPYSCYFTTPVAKSTHNLDVVIPKELSRGSTFGRLLVNLNKGKILGDKIILNLGYYPEIFNLSLNGMKVNYSDCKGLVCLDTKNFKEGDNELSWTVGQTRLQMVFNLITLLFVGAWVFILIKVRSK